MSDTPVPAASHNPDDFNYDDADLAPSQDVIDAAFSQLDALAKKSEEADDEIARIEAELKAAKERKRNIDEQQLPDLMTRMRQTKVTTLSGFVVEVAQKIRASMPPTDEPERFNAAIDWLRATHNASLIKNRVSVDLERGQDERAGELVIRLTREGFEADSKQWVEPSTFTKLVKEMLELGRMIPSAISVYNQKVASVKRAKSATVRARK